MTHLLVVDDEVSILELIKNSLGKDSIMEQHNGQLILENSKETGGAKVTMKLPC